MDVDKQSPKALSDNRKGFSLQRGRQDAAEWEDNSRT